MKMYGDSKEEALINIKKSDKARSDYYSLISHKEWGKENNYNLYIDASIDENQIVNLIEEEIKKLNLN